MCLRSAGVLDTMVVQSMVLGENVGRGDRSDGSNLPLVFVFPQGSLYGNDGWRSALR
jgi:hypothetical protein